MRMIRSLIQGKGSEKEKKKKMYVLNFAVCLDATLLPLGFELKITVGKHVVFDKKITGEFVLS